MAVDVGDPVEPPSRLGRLIVGDLVDERNVRHHRRPAGERAGCRGPRIHGDIPHTVTQCRRNQRETRRHAGGRFVERIVVGRIGDVGATHRELEVAGGRCRVKLPRDLLHRHVHLIGFVIKRVVRQRNGEGTGVERHRADRLGVGRQIEHVTGIAGHAHEIGVAVGVEIRRHHQHLPGIAHIVTAGGHRHRHLEPADQQRVGHIRVGGGARPADPRPRPQRPRRQIGRHRRAENGEPVGTNREIARVGALGRGNRTDVLHDRLAGPNRQRGNQRRGPGKVMHQQYPTLRRRKLIVGQNQSVAAGPGGCRVMTPAVRHVAGACIKQGAATIIGRDHRVERAKVRAAIRDADAEIHILRHLGRQGARHGIGAIAAVPCQIRHPAAFVIQRVIEDARLVCGTGDADGVHSGGGLAVC